MGGEKRPAGFALGGGPHRRPERQVEEPDPSAVEGAGLRDAGAGPEGSAAHPRDEEKAQTGEPPRGSARGVIEAERQLRQRQGSLPDGRDAADAAR